MGNYKFRQFRSKRHDKYTLPTVSVSKYGVFLNASTLEYLDKLNGKPVERLSFAVDPNNNAIKVFITSGKDSYKVIRARKGNRRSAQIGSRLVKEMREGSYILTSDLIFVRRGTVKSGIKMSDFFIVNRKNIVPCVKVKEVQRVLRPEQNQKFLEEIENMDIIKVDGESAVPEGQLRDFIDKLTTIN